MPYSLQGRDFDHLSHPLFYDYARRDAFALGAEPEIFDEFPPKKLEGLDQFGRWCPLPNRNSRILEL